LSLPTVPILENRSMDDVDELSVVSEMSGSVMTADGVMHGGNEKDGIDQMS